MQTRHFLAIAPLALVFAFGSFVACGPKKPPKPVETAPVEVADAGSDAAEEAQAPVQKSLYDRLGGKDGIKAVVDTFVKNVAADKRINKLFAKTTGAKLEHFKQMLIDQICEATGGDCKYTGKSMKDAHKGMKISETQFNALVEDLKMALEEKQVGEGERNDLFALLAPMKDDIVEVKDKKKEDK
jgi:hemoglobin